MEKKIRFYITLALILLIFIAGAILGFKVGGTGRPGVANPSGLNDRKIKDIERGLEEGSSRNLEGIEGAIGAAGDIEERERYLTEGLGLASDHAQNLEGGLDRIGENAEGIDGGLEDIGGILEELQKRNRRKDN